MTWLTLVVIRNGRRNSICHSLLGVQSSNRNACHRSSVSSFAMTQQQQQQHPPRATSGGIQQQQQQQQHTCVRWCSACTDIPTLFCYRKDAASGRCGRSVRLPLALRTAPVVVLGQPRPQRRHRHSSCDSDETPTSSTPTDLTVAASAITTTTTTTTRHQLFLQQLQELELEREGLFGRVDPKQNHTALEDCPNAATETTRTPTTTETTKAGPFIHDNDNDDDNDVMNDRNDERQALYNFTPEETTAWASGITAHRKTHRADVWREIQRARQQQQQQNKKRAETSEKEEGLASEGPLTHVTSDGTAVHMVDVRWKEATHRTATAQSIVVFPEAVVEALAQHDRNPTDDLVGPKGPIFATAILAGIMAAKQTSSLIPLCHPLPLEKVQVTIVWQDRTAIRIECTCSVTHRTGVEMEALTGATIAALTVYDMVKAVSHDVQITQTRLVHKQGGKRTVDRR